MNFCEFLLFLIFILSMNSIVEERVNIYCIFVLETKVFGSNGSSFNGNLVKYLQTFDSFQALSYIDIPLSKFSTCKAMMSIAYSVSLTN